jgi:hypothetical protein
MVVMVLLGFLEDTKPLRSGDPEGRRRRKDGGGLGELGRRKRQQRRIAQRLLYKDNKRRK